MIQSSSTNPNLGLPCNVEPDQELVISPPTQHDPLSSSSTECLATSNHVAKRKKKMSRKKNWIQRGKPLAFVHHARDKMLSSTSHDGGITPTSRNHVGKNHLDNAHHIEIDILCENMTLKWWNGF